MKRSQPEHRYDVIIVGAGPAGLSTALHLTRLDPSFSERILILETATHPREKLCGGGVTRLGEEALAALGLSLDVPSLPVRELRSLADQFDTSLFGSPVFRVVERKTFDAWLAEVARARGIEIRENERVMSARRRAGGVELTTREGVYRARIVVAADGAQSTVRRYLDRSRVSRNASVLLETTLSAGDTKGLRGARFGGGLGPLRPGEARFDFRRMHQGLQGYVWDFPALRGDSEAVSLGLFDSRIARKRNPFSPRPVLEQELPERIARGSRGPTSSQGVEGSVRGFPLGRYEPRRRNFSGHRVLYVGDAAGADPMLGEGIPFAFGYGEVAAEAIRDGLAREDFSFLGVYDRVWHHRITGHLKWRRRAARLFYRLRRPWTIRLLWAVIPVVTRLLILFVPKYIPGRRNRLVVNREGEVR